MDGNNLEWYVRNSVEPLIDGVKAAEIIKYNHTVNKKELKESSEDSTTRNSSYSKKGFTLRIRFVGMRLGEWGRRERM